jgi:thioredoxin-like negative regulator of GroEL
MREKLLFVFVGMIIGAFAGFLFAGSISPKSSTSTRAMPPSVTNALADARENPDNFDAQVKAAQLYYEIRRFDDAIGYLLKAHQIRDDEFEVISSLAMLNLEAGHLNEATRWFKIAMERQPTNVAVLEGYCVVMLKQGDVRTSSGLLGQIQKLDPENPGIPQLRAQLNKLIARN